MFASVLARSIISAMRRAHSAMPTIQWFVPKPVVVTTHSPSSEQMIKRECVAPLDIERAE